MRLTLVILLGFTTFLQAKEYKAVFDCSSKNSSYIVSRMFLIERTIDMITKRGDSVKFAITIHGGCAPIISKNIDEIIMDDNELENFEKARKQLKKLIAKKDVETTVCAISLNANNIEKENVISSVNISENSFIDTIGYQNDGYALMTFK